MVIIIYNVWEGQLVYSENDAFESHMSKTYKSKLSAIFPLLPTWTDYNIIEWTL